MATSKITWLVIAAAGVALVVALNADADDNDKIPDVPKPDDEPEPDDEAEPELEPDDGGGQAGGGMGHGGVNVPKPAPGGVKGKGPGGVLVPEDEPDKGEMPPEWEQAGAVAGNLPPMIPTPAPPTEAWKNALTHPEFAALTEREQACVLWAAVYRPTTFVGVDLPYGEKRANQSWLDWLTNWALWACYGTRPPNGLVKCPATGKCADRWKRLRKAMESLY